MPFVSIIIVTFNAEQFIELTLKSIAEQTDDDYELIVIDGASKDNTVKLIQKYKYLITSFVCEPDKGIYDAMNKGLDKANGRFVWFINAGDQLAAPDTLQKIKQTTNSHHDLIYGDTYFYSLSDGILGKRSELTPHKLKNDLHWTDLKLGMLVCHQSLLVSREIAPTYIIRNLSADIDWEILSFKRARQPLFLDYPLSKYLEGGVSRQRIMRSLRDRFIVLQKHFGFWQNIENHFVILLRGISLSIGKLKKV